MNYLVIGGTSGIGFEVVKQLVSENNNIISLSRNIPEVEVPGVRYFACDVTQGIDVDLDLDVIDGLVYCPGSINLKPFATLNVEDFKKDYEVNVIGLINILKKAMPLLKKSNEASVVLFSSVAASTGMPYHSIVSSSKGALEGLTLSLAAEFAPKIRFNIIAPSLTNTPLALKITGNERVLEKVVQKNPLKRIAEAEDIAKCACFLLSNESSYITGQTISVDGGLGKLNL